MLLCSIYVRHAAENDKKARQLSVGGKQVSYFLTCNLHHKYCNVSYSRALTPTLQDQFLAISRG